jgi:hypothetical protein
MPTQSGHGDVHDVIVSRSNGESLTVDDFRWIFERVTGHPIEDHEIIWEWFAEDDRQNA